MGVDYQVKQIYDAAIQDIAKSEIHGKISVA